MSDLPVGSDGAAQSALAQMTNGYWTTQVIYVAAKLKIADLLCEGPRNIQALAASTRTHAPTLYRLMRALCGLGVFVENADGGYEATALGRCLVTGSAGGLRARAILNGEQWYQTWGGLLHSVHTGGAAFDQVMGLPFVEHLAANSETETGFNEAMASSTQSMARAVAQAYDFSRCDTIVDIGGGTGAFLAGILHANPGMRGVVFDRPSVAEAAQGFLAGEGLAHRCEVAGGDFFEQVPPGGDLYLLSWVLHDWDDDASTTILRNCRRVMTPQARLLVIEQIVPPGNEASLSKLYDLHMLVLSGGRERREDEYRHLLEAADLQLPTTIATSAPRTIIEAQPRWS